jgi:hypothetical protein
MNPPEPTCLTLENRPANGPRDQAAPRVAQPYLVTIAPDA